MNTQGLRIHTYVCIYVHGHLFMSQKESKPTRYGPIRVFWCKYSFHSVMPFRGSLSVCAAMFMLPPTFIPCCERYRQKIHPAKTSWLPLSDNKSVNSFLELQPLDILGELLFLMRQGFTTPPTFLLNNLLESKTLTDQTQLNKMPFFSI